MNKKGNEDCMLSKKGKDCQSLEVICFAIITFGARLPPLFK